MSGHDVIKSVTEPVLTQMTATSDEVVSSEIRSVLSMIDSDATVSIMINYILFYNPAENKLK